MIAQKAQAKRDRAREEADAKHREELAAMHQQTLNAIHDLVNDQTPGGVGAVLAAVHDLKERSHAPDPREQR